MTTPASTTASTTAILGTGSLGAALTTGLARAGRDVVCSPRGRAAALAAAHPAVRVAASNQDAVDAADVVLVCLRRADADAALSAIAWRPDHVVASAVAGLSEDHLRRLVSPATAVARVVPLPEVADGAWATPVHPPLPAVVSVLDPLGGAVAVDTEAALDAVVTGLGTVAAALAALEGVADFLHEHGVDADGARLVVARCFAGVGRALDDAAGGERSPDLAALARAHATPGGVNEQLLTLLRTSGAADAAASALREVHVRVTRPGGAGPAAAP